MLLLEKEAKINLLLFYCFFVINFCVKKSVKFNIFFCFSIFGFIHFCCITYFPMISVVFRACSIFFFPSAFLRFSYLRPPFCHLLLFVTLAKKLLFFFCALLIAHFGFFPWVSVLRHRTRVFFPSIFSLLWN